MAYTPDAAIRRLAIPPRTLGAIGNSITAQGNTSIVAPGYSPVGGVGAKSYLMWASMLSGGSLSFAGVSATAGYTSAQIKATHLPIAQAARWGACCVLDGINDLNTGVALATIKANLIDTWQGLDGAGML